MAHPAQHSEGGIFSKRHQQVGRPSGPKDFTDTANTLPKVGWLQTEYTEGMDPHLGNS